MLEANNKIEWMHFDSNSNDSAPIPLLVSPPIVLATMFLPF